MLGSSTCTPLLRALCWCAAVALSACGDPEPRARAYVIQSLDQAIGGPKAVARPGDLVLENGHARIAILAARNSLGPGLYGGSIVDADIVRSDPGASGGRGRDQLAEIFPTVNMNVAHPAEDSEPRSVRILSDGRGGEAVVRVQGPGEPFLSLLGGLWSLVRAPDFQLWTDISTRANQPWFTLRTVVTTSPEEAGDDPPEAEDAGYQTEAFPLITWAIETGLVMGDFYLSGGSVDVFAPGIGFDEDGAVFDSMNRGENTFLDPFRFPFLAGVADGVSYGIAPREGDIFVPLFTASQTVAVGAAADGDGSDERFPGRALAYERYFFVGHGDVASVVDQYLEARGIPHGTLSGAVVERTTGAPVSGIDVFVYEPGAEAPWSHFRTDVHPDDRVPDGSFTGSLPVGTWELAAHQRGRPKGARVRVEVREGQQSAVTLDTGRFGVLEYTVRDETGRSVPSKISVFRDDGPPTRDPVLGDSFIGGAPETVVFSTYGQGEIELAPGRYRAVATRGIEYELDRSAPFTVGPAQGVRLDLQVIRSVDTAGWISADLHVHAHPSHDSGVLLADRVRTMVAEGVEFFASTDHDYLVDYAPTVEALGLEQWVQTAVGNETTTIEVGHFLAFPLAQDFLSEAGGGREGVDWTGKDPDQIIASLRMMGEAAGHEPFVFVGHPRDGILGYFDQYGFDPYDGRPGVGGEPGVPVVNQPQFSLFNDLLRDNLISWDFDGLELLNGKRFELLRTPTAPELEGFAAGTVEVEQWYQRTLAEQQELIDGVVTLAPDVEGQIDDWFTLLNLGFRFTALGNSDTHGLYSTEAGCPRNFVLVDEDDPAFLDDQAVADAVRAHRVVASYGPFVRMWIDGQPIGSEVVSDGPIKLELDVQAPTWIGVSRVELYENGTLIAEWAVPEAPDAMRFHEVLELEPAADAWYVAIVTGDTDLAPLFTPVEIPYVDLQQVVTEALAGVPSVSFLAGESIPIPRQYAVRPFALTNPIWVDRAGDGFDAPGLPVWWTEP